MPSQPAPNSHETQARARKAGCIDHKARVPHCGVAGHPEFRHYHLNGQAGLWLGEDEWGFYVRCGSCGGWTVLYEMCECAEAAS